MTRSRLCLSGTNPVPRLFSGQVISSVTALVTILLTGSGCSLLAPDSAKYTGGGRRPDASVDGGDTAEVAVPTDSVVDDGNSIPASCLDNALSVDETDIDCGGASSCPRCGLNARCVKNSDCASDNCQGSVCARSLDPCKDNALSPGETDVDCGGSCSGLRCAIGKHCLQTTDCLESVCLGNVCTEICNDQQRDADETDVDCGGSRCAKCGVNKTCVRNTDCATGVCLNTVCAVPSCSDRIVNQDESDIDCGGTVCKKCGLQSFCKVASDCDSFVCTGSACTADEQIPLDNNIDDLEDGDNVILSLGGRNGNWYPFNDGTGAANAQGNELIGFGHRTGSARAWHMSGGGYTTWGAGSGLDLYNPGAAADTKLAYNASKYSGVTFWARGIEGLPLTVLAPDANTEPALKKCSPTTGLPRCDDHHALNITLTAEWKRYHIYFAAMRTTTDTTSRVDPANLVGIQFRISPSVTFDYWVDDVAFF